MEFDSRTHSYLSSTGDSSACDAELLSQFVSLHDESAFEAMLRRHGPMVLHVARRIVGSACARAEAVPPALRIATSGAAHLFAQGGDVMATISPAVAALVQRGMTAIAAAKIKTGIVWVLAPILLAAGSGWAAHRTFIAKTPHADETTARDAPPQAAAEKRPRTDAFGDPLPPEAVARLGTIRFRHENQLTHFALSSDGHTLAALADKSVVFWNLATGQPLHRLTFNQMVLCLAFAPDGKSLAVAGQDCIIRPIDSASGKVVRQFAGHQLRNARPAPSAVSIFLGPMGAGIFQLAFSDGQTIISWGSDGTARVWDTRTGKELRQIDVHDVGQPSPDGKIWAVRNVTAMTGQAETTLHLVDAATGKVERQLKHSAEVLTVAFSPDRKTLAVGLLSGPARITLWDLKGTERKIQLLDAGTGAKLRTIEAPGQSATVAVLRWLGASPQRFLSLLFSPDSKTLYAVRAQPGRDVLSARTQVSRIRSLSHPMADSWRS